MFLRRLPSTLFPWLILVVCLGATVSAWKALRSEAQRAQNARFQQLADRITTTITSRLHNVVYLLNASEAMYLSQQKTTHAEWANYVRKLDNINGYGIIGLGIIERVKRDELDSLKARIVEDNMPGFTIEPGGQGDYAYIVTYIAPASDNSGALGLDLTKGKTRRAAADTAAIKSHPILSRRIQIIEGQNASPGFLFVSPLYSTREIPIDESQRLAKVRGWIYASVKIELLMRQVAAGANNELAFQIFEGSTLSPDSLLYCEHLKGLGITPGNTNTPRNARTLTHSLQIYGQTWTIWMTPRPVFYEGGSSASDSILLAFGLLTSVCAAGLAWTINSGRMRALSIAQRITSDLQRSEEEAQRLALVAARTHNSVILTDADGRITWVNEGFTRITGYSQAEVIGRKPGNILTGPGSNRETLARMHAAFERKESFTEEILNYTKDGRSHWIELEAQPLYDERRNVTGWMGIASDITGRKRIAEELAIKESRFRLIFEAVPFGIRWRHVAPDGTVSDLMNDAHLALCDITYEQSQTPGIFARITHPDDMPVQMALSGRLQRGEIDRFSMEKRYVHRDGSIVWVVFSVMRKQHPDGSYEELSTVVNISEQKRIHAELREAKENADNASNAKSAFLATMSHEIRTPMNGVIGMASLLLDTPLSLEQKEYVETIRNSGDSLLAIINDILDFSKIESGRLELENEPFNLHSTVEGVIDILASKAAEKHIDLCLEIADEVPKHIKGDSTRFGQVLINLIGNAIKFTPKGEVEIRCTVSPSFVPEHNTIVLLFVVRDSGIGIPKDALGRLFQSFTQADTSTTRRFGGTGLGLAISRRLVEMMGGSIHVTSEEGKGSTFSFTMRFHLVDSDSKPEPVDDFGSILTNRTLLLADDNDTSRRILTKIAEKSGIRVAAYASPSEAIKGCSLGTSFDFAILDHQMPDMDGCMLAREIRRILGPATPPLILLSSLGQKITEEDRSLFYTILAKPAKPTVIRRLLAQVCDPKLQGRQTSQPLPYPATTSEPSIHHERILLAEDNIINQRVAIHMLTRMGYRVDIAGNGVEALQAVDRQPYDIILMDVQMPEMNGLDAARAIRSRKNLAVRPWIIALTANAMKEDKDNCLEAGMDDYIAKPIQASELRAAMDRVNQAKT